MAIWQYTFEIIPKERVTQLGGFKSITSDDYDESDFWENYDYDIGFFRPLTAEMKPGNSWNDDIIIYGDAESTCIKFIMENGKVTEVVVRIDFRYDYSEILNSIIEFCYMNDLVIMADLKLLDLNATFILNRIENSKQFITYKNLFG